ncbi:MAG: 50S ribosomal protein L17, partial [Hymenobacter sp.]
VFATLQNKESMKELFGSVAEKIATRPGGYTRILKLSATRLGDNADMCIIELVDFNETLLEAKNATEAKSTTTRRSRRRGGKAETAGNEAGTSAAVVADAPAATTSQEAPADTATDALTNGETREEAEKAE